MADSTGRDAFYATERAREAAYLRLGQRIKRGKHFMHGQQLPGSEVTQALARLGTLVYFLAYEDNLVKIGTTTHLPNRLKALRRKPADLLAAEPGDQDRERELHRQFVKDRVYCELFRRSDSLEAYMAERREEMREWLASVA